MNASPAKIVVFGASGSVGTHIVDQSLAKGHTVTAFVRTPSKLKVDHPRLTVIRGDVLVDRDKVAAAVEGQDAVLVALGAGRQGGVRSEGTRIIIEAMKRAGVRRLVCQSTLGAGDSFANLGLMWKLVFRLLLRKALADHQLQEKHVRGSGLDWTIVRPAAFTDGALSGNYRHGFGPREKGLTQKISRADVAEFLLREVGNDRYMGMAPGLSY